MALKELAVDEEAREIFAPAKWSDCVSEVFLSGSERSNRIDEWIQFGTCGEVDAVAVAADVLSSDLVGEGKVHVNFGDDFGGIGGVDAHLGSSFNRRSDDINGDFESAKALGAIAVFELIANLTGLQDDRVKVVAASAPSPGGRLDLVGGSYFGEAAIQRENIHQSCALGFPVAGAFVVRQHGVVNARAEDQEVPAVESVDGNS